MTPDEILRNLEEVLTHALKDTPRASVKVGADRMHALWILSDAPDAHRVAVACDAGAFVSPDDVRAGGVEDLTISVFISRPAGLPMDEGSPFFSDKEKSVIGRSEKVRRVLSSLRWRADEDGAHRHDVDARGMRITGRKVIRLELANKSYLPVVELTYRLRITVPPAGTGEIITHIPPPADP